MIYSSEVTLNPPSHTTIIEIDTNLANQILLKSGKYLPEDVVMDVVLLGRLRRQHKGLHKPPHWLAVVGQLPRDLDHHSGGKGGVGVHLHYFKTYVNIINI